MPLSEASSKVIRNTLLHHYNFLEDMIKQIGEKLSDKPDLLSEIDEWKIELEITKQALAELAALPTMRITPELLQAIEDMADDWLLRYIPYGDSWGDAHLVRHWIREQRRPVAAKEEE